MPLKSNSRRRFQASMLTLPLTLLAAKAMAMSVTPTRASITAFGAVADGNTLNTRSIQATIDHVAAQGGGTVDIPAGVFLSGALFLKPKVNLHFAADAVLKCSTDAKDFPVQRTRIEGHFEESFNPALINANGCDGLQITGAGTLDGAGRPIWDLFWKLRNAAPDKHNFANLSVPRARLAIIENSRDVLVDGIRFKDSQFWNLHLYRCKGVQVRHARFEVPDDYPQAPSTDGIDIDSSQDVSIEGCFFSVTDDCIAAKGSKGPQALEDSASPPVERVRIRNCVFKRGNGILTLGSEATIVRDIIVEDCQIIGEVKVANLKLRPDTPQRYEDIHYRNITVDASTAPLLQILPWSQYKDLKGAAPPQSSVRNISLVGIRGRAGSLGRIEPNPGQTTISDILLKDVDVQLAKDQSNFVDVTNLKFDNVRINGVQRST